MGLSLYPRSPYCQIASRKSSVFPHEWDSSTQKLLRAGELVSQNLAVPIHAPFFGDSTRLGLHLWASTLSSLATLTVCLLSSGKTTIE